MSVSIIETLENVQYSLDNLVRLPMLLPLVREQLNNAVVLLEKGYDIETEVEPLLKEYGKIENVPINNKEV